MYFIRRYSLQPLVCFLVVLVVMYFMLQGAEHQESASSRLLNNQQMIDEIAQKVYQRLRKERLIVKDTINNNNNPSKQQQESPSEKIMGAIKPNVPETTTENEVKREFNLIYRDAVWSNQGGGSGLGSGINHTVTIRGIIENLIDEFSIKSMLDAPCGSFHWMPLLLNKLKQKFEPRGLRFRYHGVDVVDLLIEKARAEYANETDWQFSVREIATDKLPDNYELILSRDALQHLSYEKIFYALRAYSRIKRARFLLVGSYLGKHGMNYNIKIGEYFPIDLTAEPFNLKGYMRTYDEKIMGVRPKSIVLYDIPNYLRKFDFDALKKRLKI